jgi:hypothetical protein
MWLGVDARQSIFDPPPTQRFVPRLWDEHSKSDV